MIKADQSSSNNRNIPVKVSNIFTKFGTKSIHEDISFEIKNAEVTAIIGASGSGKSTLLREIVGLLRPTSGSVYLFGTNVWESGETELKEVRARFGMLFQNGALFSGLSVAENIAVPLKEQKHFSDQTIKEIVALRLEMVGLELDVASKMPNELSGGMRKRVALARALSLEPELLFLDEPTSGLDPVSARAFDKLIKSLSVNLGLSVVMITHDLESIKLTAERIIILDNKKILVDGNFEKVANIDNEWVRDYFKGSQ